MARGVDIPEVNWVIQFDPPSNARSDNASDSFTLLNARGNNWAFLIGALTKGDP